MAFGLWHKWLKSIFLFRNGRPLRRTKSVPIRFRPHFESLEERDLLATVTWMGSTGPGANANWTNGANWQGGIAPTPGDELVFPATATTFVSNNDFIADTKFGPITIANPATGYLISGNRIVIQNRISVSGTFAGQFLVPLRLAGNTTLDGATGSFLAIGGVIDGSGDLIKEGAGFVRLQSSGNGYTGTTRVNNGTLALDRTAKGGPQIPGPLIIGDGAGGPGSDTVDIEFDEVIADSASVTINSSGRLTFSNTDVPTLTETIGSLTMTGGSIQDDANQVNLILTGDVSGTSDSQGNAAKITLHDFTIGTNRTFDISDGPGLVDMTLSLTGQGQYLPQGQTTPPSPGALLLKIGAGTLLLNGSTTTGQIDLDNLVVADGSVIINTPLNEANGPGNVTVNAGGTLRGNGGVADHELTVNGGTLSPGFLDQPAFAFEQGSFMGGRYIVDLDSTTQFDQLIPEDGLAILGDPQLIVNANFNVPIGTSFRIVDGENGGGTFAGLPDGATFLANGQLFRINYTPSGTNAGVLLTKVCSPSEAFIRGLYNDILDRSQVASQEIAYWLNVLAAGASRQDVVGSFWVSQGHRENEIAAFYQQFLGRTPLPQETAFWLGVFNQGGTEGDITLAFLTTPAYNALHPTNSDYVASLYQNVLERAGTGPGIVYWTTILNNGARSRLDVAYYFLASDESTNLSVGQYYTWFLKRSVEAAGEAYWFNQWMTGQLTALSFAQAIVGSDEYYATAFARFCTRTSIFR